MECQNTICEASDDLDDAQLMRQQHCMMSQLRHGVIFIMHMKIDDMHMKIDDVTVIEAITIGQDAFNKPS